MKATIHKRRPKRSGFTLIELLVVIVIIGIIISLSAAAYISSIRTARVAATESMMTIVSQAMSDRVESYFSITRSGSFKPSAASVTFATANSNDRQRATAIEKIERFRAYFPQEYRDFFAIDPGNGSAPFGDSLSDDGPINSYRQVVQERIDAGVDLEALLENEGSECLFLILKYFDRGATKGAINDIPTRFLRDTDEDGMMEILDAWGNPVRFYRWPTDLLAYLIEIEGTLPPSLMQIGRISDVATLSNIDPEGSLMLSVWWTGNRDTFENPEPDPLIPPTSAPFLRARRYYRLHAAYETIGDRFSDPDPTKVRAYPIIPVVVSAGPDGMFGMHLEPSGDENEPTDLSVRCGRVDTTSEESIEQFNDNLLSIKVQSGASQL